MRKFIAAAVVLSCLSLIITAVDAQTSGSPASSIFTVVPTPNGHSKPFQNDLHSVSASSSSDIWAVGQTSIHFDGNQWKAFPVPLIHGDNTSRLGGVVDFAPDNVWAVGLINIGT